MDRYQRVEKPRTDAPINENEISITTQGRMWNYITYAITLVQQKGSDEISLKAMERAINKTVMIAELIKRRIAGLHQITSLGSADITDILETTRHVSVITITLSRKELDTSSIRYQLPNANDQVKPLVEYEHEGYAYDSFSHLRCNTCKQTTENPVLATKPSSTPASKQPIKTPTTNPITKESCLTCCEYVYFKKTRLKIYFFNWVGSQVKDMKTRPSYEADVKVKAPHVVKKVVDINHPQNCKNKGCDQTFK
ncbi:hypothetical protein LXL04_017649 [Taraxacum kok-saghyz]